MNPAGWHDITLAIIAGGRATRLGGRVKPLLRVGPSSILERLNGLLPTSDRLLVTNDPRPFDEHWRGPLVGDVEPGFGAPGGVVTALLEARTPWVFVVAGDMPFVSMKEVEALRPSSQETALVVVATRDGELEPLCAMYRASLGALWRGRLVENPSLRALVRGVPHRQVDVDPASVESINTADELRRFGGS